ncbi:MAG TPA: hypothetical protein VFW65_11010 [Pseudonocardiaceae bacterium]|nr:hypothetical protein [Pseudonocardiaceae bacterium]
MCVGKGPTKARPPAPDPPGDQPPLVPRVTVRVGDRQLALSNLDKVHYPADGFSNGASHLDLLVACLVFDLDPGPGTTIVECALVAGRLRERLQADRLTPFPYTSGSKGMQPYCPIHTDDPDRPSGYARALALRLRPAGRPERTAQRRTHPVTVDAGHAARRPARHGHHGQAACWAAAHDAP